MVDSNLGWMFEEASSLGVGKGDFTPTSKFDGKISTFLREAIQNSADAKWPSNNNEDVEVNIKIHKLTGQYKEKFLASLGWGELEPHLKAVASSESNAENLNIKINQGLNKIKNSLFLVSIEDFNTSGLYGQEPVRYGEDGYEDYRDSTDTNAFASAAYGIGKSDKQNNLAGGSFGYGKFALMGASMIQTLLYNSNISNSEGSFAKNGRVVNLTNLTEGKKLNRFIGQCGLSDHEDLKTKKPFGSIGQFGNIGTYEKENNIGTQNIHSKVESVWNDKELVKSLYLDRGNKPGTTVMLVGYNSNQDIEEKDYEQITLQEIVNIVKEQVSVSFWPAIVKNPKFGGVLKVSVEALENEEHIVKKEVVNPNDFVEPFVSLLKKYEEGLLNPEHDLDTESIIKEVGDSAARVIHVEIPETKKEAEVGKKYHKEVIHDLSLLTQVVSKAKPNVPTECLNRVALVRGPGMVVNYEFSGTLKNIPKSFISLCVAGTFIQSDDDAEVAEIFFRNTENVQHNKWEVSEAIKTLYSKKQQHLTNKILKPIPNKVRELFKSRVSATSDIPEYMQKKLTIPGIDTETVDPPERTSFLLKSTETILNNNDYDISAEIIAPKSFEGTARLQITAYEAATKNVVPIIITKNSISKAGNFVDNDILEIVSEKLNSKRVVKFKCKIKNSLVGMNPSYTGLVLERIPKILREV